MTELESHEETGQVVRVSGPNGSKPKVYIEQTSVKITTLVSSLVVVFVILSAMFAGYYRMLHEIDKATYKRWNQASVHVADEVRKKMDPTYPALSMKQINEIADMTRPQ